MIFIGIHKYTEGFCNYFINENYKGIDLGNIELKTLKPMFHRNKMYYRFMFFKKDLKAKFVLIYHLQFKCYYLIKQKEYSKLRYKSENSSVLQTEIEKLNHLFFKNGSDMIKFVKKIIFKKYLIDSNAY